MIARLAIIALVVPALAPLGAMLANESRASEIVLTICSGFGSRQVIMDLASGEIRDPNGTLTASQSTSSNVPADSPSDRNPVQCPLCLINETGDVSTFRIAAVVATTSIYTPTVIDAPPPVGTIHHPPRGPPATA